MGLKFLFWVEIYFYCISREYFIFIIMCILYIILELIVKCEIDRV